MRPTSRRVRCRKAVSEVSLPGSCHSSSSADDPYLPDDVFIGIGSLVTIKLPLKSKNSRAAVQSNLPNAQTRACGRFAAPPFSCAVVAVADSAVTVVATEVGTEIDVTAAGGKVVLGSSDKEEK
jgi:hypothetical protein